MQAIITKFLAPTNHRDTRIKATASAGSITAPYYNKLSVEENHKKAAEMFRAKYEWTSPYYGEIYGGQMPNGDYVWVMVPQCSVCASRALVISGILEDVSK